MSVGKTGSFKRARRTRDVRGFGIDRTAVAAEATTARPDRPILRLENLDTDLPLPPEAIPETISGPRHRRGELVAAVHRRPGPAGGDLRLPARPHRPPLRPADRDRRHERRHRAASSRCCWRRSTRATQVLLTDPTYAGLVNRVRSPAACRASSPYRGARRRVAARPRRLRRRPPRGAALTVLMSPSMPSGAVLTATTGAAVAQICRDERPAAASTTRRWSACCSTAASSSIRVHFDGMAERTLDRRLAVQGVPHDRLAGRLGRRAARARRGRRLGARLQHDDAGRHRPRRPPTAVLRGDHGHVARRASPSSSAAATRSSPRCRAGRSSRPPAAGRC